MKCPDGRNCNATTGDSEIQYHKNGIVEVSGELVSSDLLTNPFTLFGFLWGIPVPLFFLYFHRSLTAEPLTEILLNYKLHWFFLAHPVFFALFFGVIGRLYLNYHEQLKYRATHDELTKLLNHSEFQNIGNTTVSDLNPESDAVSLLLFDLDHFKRVNDSLGHQQGDEVLKAVAETLVKKTRDPDYICRYGGEEFSVLLPRAGASEAHEIAERIRRTIASEEGAVPGWLTVSVGVASYPEDGSTFDELIRVADQRLYVAKSDGRNRTI